jgi:hypothetical protein
MVIYTYAFIASCIKTQKQSQNWIFKLKYDIHRL